MKAELTGGPAPVDPLGDRLTRLVWFGRPTDSLAERARRRITVRLMPVLFVLYILAYLDRANVSVAELKMKLPPDQGGLGLSTEMIGFGGGLFFLGYWILEIPTALSVRRYGARWLFCRILVLWGLCATLIGFVGLPIAERAFGLLPEALYGQTLATSPEHQFYFFRFMLGFFEGGFFPCVIVYLTYWFRAEDRAKAVATFTAASPLSMALGLPLSRLLLPLNWFDLPGWRWVFILEGLLPVLAGVAVLWLLPDRPETVAWLPDDEREWLTGALEREHQHKHAAGADHHWRHLGMVGLLTCVYFCLNVGVYGLVLFMPGIIKSQLASTWSDEAVTMLASLPYFLAIGGMAFNGWHSDRTRERVWHTAIPLMTVSAGIFLTAMFDGVPIVPVVIMILVVGPAMFGHMPTFWPIPTMVLGATAAAASIGLINMLGNLGGFVGPYLLGVKAKDSPPAATAALDPGAKGVADLSGQASATEPAASADKDAGAHSKPEPQGVNFRESLLWLAPWPLGAAVLILIIGYCIVPQARDPARAGPRHGERVEAIATSPDPQGGI